MDDKNILVVGTFDTKNDELEYLSQQILKLGGKVTRMDVSVLGIPTVKVDITKDDIAKAANSSIKAAISFNDENNAITINWTSFYFSKLPETPLTPGDPAWNKTELGFIQILLVVY